MFEGPREEVSSCVRPTPEGRPSFPEEGPSKRERGGEEVSTPREEDYLLGGGKGGEGETTGRIPLQGNGRAKHVFGYWKKRRGGGKGEYE